jgi:hypothetical protein
MKNKNETQQQVVKNMLFSESLLAYRLTTSFVKGVQKQLRNPQRFINLTVVRNCKTDQ